MPIAKNDIPRNCEEAYPLKQIYFYLTDECNLRCRHCWISPKFTAGRRSDSSLSLSVFGSITEQAKPLGLSSVKLTGGEPLLHPEFPEILSVVRSHGLGLVVETNGLLVTPEIANALGRIKDVSVSVSLDGADAETHESIRGVEGSFDGALAGIRALVEAGIKPQIIMTLLNRNRKQVEKMVRLAESLGAGSVKFNLVQPTARGERIHRESESVEIEELMEIGRMVEKTLSETTPLTLIFHWPMAFQPLKNVLGRGGNGCGNCGVLSILGVLEDGAYALCGIGENVPDLIFGHAEKDPLVDVWRHARVLSELREGLPGRLEGICGDCLMKQRCRGTCIAQNYYRKKSLWAPFWFCAQARERGLFPETRLRPGSGSLPAIELK